MADTKISALTALTGANVATDDALAIVDTSATTTKKITAEEYRKYVLTPRGALVKLAANLTAQNFSAGPFIGWTAEVYDTDSIHDNTTNNSRLSVPSGW